MDGMRYQIEKTRNRTSRAVLREGVVLIRLARGLRPDEERLHTESLLRRMAKMYAREAAKTRIDPFGPLFRGTDTVHIDLATGSIVSFRVQDGRRTKAMRVAGGWSVLRGLTTDDRTFRGYLWRLLSASAQEETKALVGSINTETFCVPISEVTTKFMRSRWGSCSTHGVIALSTPLLLTSPEIVRYVIIHELAHRIRQDHSKAFWELVSLHEPKYKELVKKLRNYTLPSR